MAENIQKVILTADNLTKSAFSAFRKDVTDADKSVLALEKSSQLLKNGLGALGISLSGAAFAGMIKGVADAQDKLAKLSASTGIAIDTLAGLQFAAEQSGTSVERVGKAVTNFSRIVLESNGETDKYSRLIKALGLDLESLKSATPEQQFISLAGAIKNNVAEQDRAAAVTALLGSRYTELIPLLSQGEQGLRDMIARGKELNPVTAESAAKAEKFNDNLDELMRVFDSFKVEAGNKIIPALAEITSEIVEATRKSGLLAGALAGIKSAAGLATGSVKLTEIDIQKQKIASLRQELASLNDRKHIPVVGDLIFDKRQADLLAQRIDDAVDDLALLEKQALDTAEALSAGIEIPEVKNPPRSFVNILKDIDSESKKASASTKTVTKSLSEEEKQAQETARKIEQLTLKFDPLIAYNKELNELISLRASGLPDSVYSAAVAESIDKYTKATGGVADGITEIDEKTRQLEITTRQVFDTNEQIAINGIRGIQNTIADGLFNAARNGMDGMVMAVRDGLIRVAAEFASARLLKGSGIGALFGLESGSAVSGGGSGGLSAFSAGYGGDALGGLIAGGYSSAAASLASFGSFLGQNTNFGYGGIALAGGSALGASSISTGVATALATFGGPYGALAAAVVIALDILNKNFGNHEIRGDLKPVARATQVIANPFFGAEYGINQFERLLGTNIVSKALPGAFVEDVLGLKSPDRLLANALFGRGVPKFQNEAIVGNVTAEGFEGVLNQAFKEKGSVFKSSRTSNFIVDTDSGELLSQFGRLSESGNIRGDLRDAVTESSVKRAIEFGKFLDETFKDIGDSIKSSADRFGLSKDALNAVSVELDLVSEKGETLSEQQISEQIARISEEMIVSLIPSIEDLAKKGESVTDTFNRFNAQFSVLESAVMLFGNTAEQAAEKVRALGIDGQTAFIDSIGGVDVAAAEISEFYNNVFTDAQKLEVTKNQILGVLRPLGVDFIPTLAQLYDAVASGNPQLIQAALKIDGLVVEFNRLNESVTGIDLSGIDKIADSENLIATRRQTLIDVYRRESDALKTTIDRFRSLGAVLTDARDSLALSELSPLTPQQRLDEARRQFNVDRSAASLGDVDALNRLPESGRAFLQASQIFNASSAEFVSDFNFVKSVLDSAAKVADTEADIAARQLAELDKTVSELVEINAGVKSLDDAIFELKEAVLQGFGNTSISDDIIRDFVNAQGRTVDQILNAAVKNGVSADQISKVTGIGLADISKATGGLSVSGDQIRQFVQSNINDPFSIYSAAKDFGITLSRVAKETGIPIKDIEAWTRANNLPMFDRGTDFVQKGGLAVLHRAEAVTPASSMADMAREISELRKELSELRREQNQQTGALINVAMQSQRENAQTIVAANKELAKNDGWRKQVGGGLR